MTHSPIQFSVRSQRASEHWPQHSVANIGKPQSVVRRLLLTRQAKAQAAAQEVRQRLELRNPNPKSQAYGFTPDCTFRAGEEQPQVQVQAEVGGSTVSKQSNRKQPQQPVCPAVTE